MAETRIGRVGSVDRAVRFILGIVLVGFALACPWAAELGPEVQWVSGVVGVVLIGTAAMRFCPLYRMIGVCTG